MEVEISAPGGRDGRLGAITDVLLTRGHTVRPLARDPEVVRERYGDWAASERARFLDLCRERHAAPA